MADIRDITSIIPVWPNRPVHGVRRDKEHTPSDEHKDREEHDAKDDEADGYGIDEYA